MDSFKDGPIGEFAKPSPEQLTQYKVPVVSLILAGLATSLQVACLIITFAWLVSALLPDLVGPLPGWLPYALTGIAFFGYCRTWWFARDYRYDSTFVEYAEYVVIGVASFTLFLSTRLTNGGLAFVLAVSLVASWAIGRVWLNQIFRLYDQPYELLAKQGRFIVSNGEQARFFDQNLAYKLITQRLRLAFAPAVLVVTWAASHEAQGIDIPAMATVIYVLVSIGLIAWARQRFLRTSWEQDKVQNLTRVNRRWIAYFGILIVLAVLPTLFLPSGPNETLGTLLRQWLQGDRPPINPQDVFKGQQNDEFQQQVEQNRAERQNPDQFSFNLPDWAVIGLSVAATILIIWLTIYFLGKAGWAGPKLKEIKFRQYALTTATWFKSLPSAIIGFFKLMFSKDDTDYGEPHEDKPRRPGLLNRFRRPSVPPEARDQIRYYYQYMSLRASKVGLERKKGQTPAEYADYLQPQAADLAPELDTLTQLYHEARFSPHPIQPEQADRAKNNASRLADHFKRSKKVKSEK